MSPIEKLKNETMIRTTLKFLEELEARCRAAEGVENDTIPSMKMSYIILLIFQQNLRPLEDNSKFLLDCEIDHELSHLYAKAMVDLEVLKKVLEVFLPDEVVRELKIRILSIASGKSRINQFMNPRPTINEEPRENIVPAGGTKEPSQVQRNITYVVENGNVQITNNPVELNNRPNIEADTNIQSTKNNPMNKTLNKRRKNNNQDDEFIPYNNKRVKKSNAFPSVAIRNQPRRTTRGKTPIIEASIEEESTQLKQLQTKQKNQKVGIEVLEPTPSTVSVNDWEEVSTPNVEKIFGGRRAVAGVQETNKHGS